MIFSCVVETFTQIDHYIIANVPGWVKLLHVFAVIHKLVVLRLLVRLQKHIIQQLYMTDKNITLLPYGAIAMIYQLICAYVITTL